MDGTDIFGGFVPLNFAYSVEGIDIAVLHLNLPRHVETNEPLPTISHRLKLDFPTPGERLIALGYEESEWERDGLDEHSLSQRFTASTGFVAELWPHGRDRVVHPTPCFQTSAPFKSGMSGGPVIDARGFVVGVVSTSFDLSEGQEPISYAAPIAPAMGISLDGLDEAGKPTSFFLWDFANGGALSVDTNNVTVNREPETLRLSVGDVTYSSALSTPIVHKKDSFDGQL